MPQPPSGAQNELSQELDALGQLGPIMPTDFMQTLDNLGDQLTDRAGQLLLLEKLLLSRGFNDSILGIGRIVDRGWISFLWLPYRSFMKRVTLHKGLDISGREGTPIRSVAPGIIRFSGKRSGFGNLVEIDHGNGFVTRYAHNHNNVTMGGHCGNKGQIIADMGSSGRSTGSHVHFEILRNGDHLNPLAYINKPRRARKFIVCNFRIIKNVK